MPHGPLAAEVPKLKAAWIETCVSVVKAGCTGCFIDQANLNVAGFTLAAGKKGKKAAAAFSAGHLA